MKAFKIFSQIIFAAILAVGCSERITPENPFEKEGEVISIIANLPTGDDLTKLTYSDDGNGGLMVTWSEEESFSVIRGGENSTFSKSEGNEFSGILPDDEGSGVYYALYPANTLATDHTKVPFSLSVQNGVLDSKLNYMIASAEVIVNDGEIDFRHFSSLLVPSFSGMAEGEVIRTITVETEVPCNGTINMEDLSVTAGENSTISVQMKEDHTGKIYIYIPPMDADKSLKFTVTTTSGKTYGATIVSSKKIVPGVHYSTSIALTQETSDVYRWHNGITATSTENIQGSGTEADPYIIHTASDLQWLIEQSNYADKTIFNNNSSDYTKVWLTAGKHYRLTHDLYIDSAEDIVDGEGNVTQERGWTPIGSGYYDKGINSFHKEYRAFVGSFDGGGHTIRGNMIPTKNCLSEDGNIYFGLFGMCTTVQEDPDSYVNWYDASIKNLHMDVNVNCTISPNSGSKKSYVGAIVGYMETNGTTPSYIINCTNRGSVQGGLSTYENNSTFVGGLIGRTEGTPINIYDCHNYGAITNGADATDQIRSFAYTGGIAGTFYSEITFTNCTNNAPIISNHSYKEANIGGLAGSVLRENMTNCHNYATIEAKYTYENETSPSIHIGGLVGTEGDSYSNGNNIYNCSNTAEIKVSTNSDDEATTVYAGGLFGSNATGIVSCTNTGKITIGSCRVANIGGLSAFANMDTNTISGSSNSGEISFTGEVRNVYLGGLFGKVNSNSGSIGMVDCVNYSDISGNDHSVTSHVGGIAAECKIPLTHCINYGDVEGGQGGDEEDLDGSNYGSTYAGGLAGRMLKAVSNCTNYGNVSTRGSNQLAYVGGLIGETYQPFTISQSTNKGTVTGGNAKQGAFTGGLIGRTYTSSTDKLVIDGCINEGAVVGGYVYNDLTESSPEYDYPNRTATTGGLVGALDYKNEFIRGNTTNKGAITAGTRKNERLVYNGKFVGYVEPRGVNDKYQSKVCICTKDESGSLLDPIGGGYTELWTDDTGCSSTHH